MGVRLIALLSAGLFFVPVTKPVVDHVQPIIPPPVAAPERGVPGYACGHPRPGFEYTKLKGVGKLPNDILTGKWMCSDGCGPEIDCATHIRYGDPEKKMVSEFAYVYRRRAE